MNIQLLSERESVPIHVSYEIFLRSWRMPRVLELDQTDSTQYQPESNQMSDSTLHIDENTSVTPISLEVKNGHPIPFRIRIVLSPGAKAPTRSSKGAAGYDLYSNETLTIPAGESGRVSTGVAMQLPSGWFGSIRDRSGLAWKSRLGIGGGVIDEDYTGVISVILHNNSKIPFSIARWDRIAQMIFQRYAVAEFDIVTELTETDRGDKGFGSSGV